MSTIVVPANVRDELYRSAYGQVQNPDDPNGPIDCEVPWELGNLYMQAIEFMTGLRPAVECKGHTFRLTTGG